MLERSRIYVLNRLSCVEVDHQPGRRFQKTWKMAKPARVSDFPNVDHAGINHQAPDTFQQLPTDETLHLTIDVNLQIMAIVKRVQIDLNRFVDNTAKIVPAETNRPVLLLLNKLLSAQDRDKFCEKNWSSVKNWYLHCYSISINF